MALLEGSSALPWQCLLALRSSTWAGSCALIGSLAGRGPDFWSGPGCLAAHFLVASQNPGPTYSSLVCVDKQTHSKLSPLIPTDSGFTVWFTFELFLLLLWLLRACSLYWAKPPIIPLGYMYAFEQGSQIISEHPSPELPLPELGPGACSLPAQLRGSQQAGVAWQQPLLLLPVRESNLCFQLLQPVGDLQLISYSSAESSALFLVFFPSLFFFLIS